MLCALHHQSRTFSRCAAFFVRFKSSLIFHRIKFEKRSARSQNDIEKTHHRLHLAGDIITLTQFVQITNFYSATTLSRRKWPATSGNPCCDGFAERSDAHRATGLARLGRGQPPNPSARISMRKFAARSTPGLATSIHFKKSKSSQVVNLSQLVSR